MYSTSIFFFSTTVYNDYNGYPCVEAVVPSSCARYTQRCRELLSAAKVSSRFVSRVIGHERNSMRSLLVSDLLRNVRPRRAATGRAQMRSHVLRLVRSPVVRDEQRFARIAVNTNERGPSSLSHVPQALLAQRSSLHRRVRMHRAVRKDEDRESQRGTRPIE